MELQLARIWRLGLLALVLSGIAFLVAGNRAEANDPAAPSTDHCVCRHNAQQKKEITNYGALADGEVGLGREQMKDVHLFNLQYLAQSAGQFQYKYWNGYVNYQQEAPYSNIPGGANDLFDHGP
ncbi:hypothetical protein FBQ82_14935 [Anaerolineae bacterium CFX7]|nr:hypothetical protein [Anaerolineae bacterium CFX7]